MMGNNWFDSHHHWSWMERSVESADRFYQHDQNLSIMDRERLADFFQQRKSLAPIFGISAAIGLSFLPFMLRHRGFTMARQAVGHFPRHRGFIFGRIFLAFVGYKIGQKAGDAALRSYQRDQLWGREAAAGAYSVMDNYPPEVGLQYFRSTARNPSLLMKDPRRNNQSREPPFPMNLMYGRDRETLRFDHHRGPHCASNWHHQMREDYRSPPQSYQATPVNESQPSVSVPAESPMPRSSGLWSNRKD